GACRWGSNCHVAQDRKTSQVCRYFQRGFCFHGDQCSYQHPKHPSTLWWGHRHSEPHITLPGTCLRLTRRGSEPTYLPSVAMGCGHKRDLRPGSEQNYCSKSVLLNRNPGLGLNPPPPAYGASALPLSPRRCSSLLRTCSLKGCSRHCCLAGLGKQDSQDVVCGICMDKVWDKPEAERVFGILPNCSHAHCLGCLRTWRKNRQDFPLDVIKACPQCRVHSSYIIPHKFWVSEGPEKEQLIRNFKARTSQIRCRFFTRGNGRCPFNSDCIYLHQLPTK
uniref:RING-type E3 ubiquitin transferase n=1 Tax=Otolemur garnettii TaxID=30611 RepID=H0XLP3_OTOGA